MIQKISVLRSNFGSIAMSVLSGLFVFCAFVAQAATITALDPSAAQVGAAIAAAVSGDTVLIPAGTATWTNETVATSKRLKILGAGIGKTTIIRGTNGSVLFSFSRTGSDSNKLVEFGNMTIDAGVADYGILSIGGFSEVNRYFRFHDLEITNIGHRGITIFGVAQGVVDHCQFNAPAGTSAQAISIFGFLRYAADQRFQNSTNVYQFGTDADYVYVEDCGFDFHHNDGVFDMYADGHVVFRYNHITNANWMSVHEYGMNSRSACQWEFYMNYATNTGGANAVAQSHLRSGAGVTWSNSMWSVAALDGTPRLSLYRASGTNLLPTLHYYPVDSVTGTNRLDGNNNSIALGYPALDQPGWGDPVTFTETNSIQTFYGCYEWENFFNGTNVNWSVQSFGSNTGLLGWNGLTIPTPAELLVEGRDFFNDKPKPGYKPFSYPHPLTKWRPNLRILGP